MSERPTVESGCSSWPTAVAGDGEKCSNPRRVGDRTLPDEAKKWPTAKVATGDYCYTNGDHNKPVLNLEGVVRQWPTAGANDHKGTAREGQRRGQLDEAAEQKWATPKASTGGADPTHRPTGKNLKFQTERWQTPATFQGKYRRQVGQTERAELLLPGQAELLLPGQAEHFHLAPTSSRSGDKSSTSTSTRRLNPRFVEWLMGLPPRATELTGSGLSATEWCHYKRRMRTEFLRLVSRNVGSRAKGDSQ